MYQKLWFLTLQPKQNLLQKRLLKLTPEVSAPDKVATVADKVEQEGKVASVETGEPEVPDASVENTDDESANLSESLPNKTEVEKLVSVESEDEIYMKDLSQPSKELSEVEINKKGSKQ